MLCISPMVTTKNNYNKHTKENEKRIKACLYKEINKTQRTISKEKTKKLHNSKELTK